MECFAGQVGSGGGEEEEQNLTETLEQSKQGWGKETAVRSCLRALTVVWDKPRLSGTLYAKSKNLWIKYLSRGGPYDVVCLKRDEWEGHASRR